MRFNRLAQAAALAAAVVTLAASGSAGATTAGTSLPLTGFSHMLVDGAHGHVFVTGSASDSAIVVLNEDGTTAGTIADEAGAGGMVLDGNTLYVARCGGENTIDEIDTATLTRTGSFAAPVGGTCDLAEAGGVLWFSNSTDHQFGHVESVSLDSSHTVVDSGLNMYQVIFATTPAHPDWLIMTESGLSPTVGWIWDVSDRSAVSQVAYKFNLGSSGFPGDIATTPDGSQLLVAPASPSQVQVFSLPGLATAKTYTASGSTNSVAVSPSGELIAGGASAASGKDVFLYDAGKSAAVASWDFGAGADTLYPRGLAFSPDGSTLFAVSKGSAGNGVVFHTLSTVVLPKGRITLRTSAATVTTGHPVTLTAHLGTAGANRMVSIYRRPAGGSRSLVKTARVGAAGNMSVQVRPSWNTSYTAVWSGDAGHAPTTSAAVSVKARVIVHGQAKGAYRTLRGYHLYHYRPACERASHAGCPVFLAHSTPLRMHHMLKFVVQYRSGSGWRKVLSGSGVTGSNGKLALTLFYTGRGVVGASQRIRFTMARDSYALGNTSAWTYFRVTG